MANKTSALDVSKINLNSPVTASRAGSYSGVQNPYSNQTYTQGWLDRTLGDLGFRTKADQRAEDMDIQAAEFEAGLALKQHDEEYNSPAAKAARMRAAGLNPDLLGVDQAENASAMGEDPSTPQPAPSSDGEQLMNLGRSLLNGVSTAIGFVKDFASIESLNIQNASGLLGLGNDSLLSLFPDGFFEDGQLRSDLPIDIMNRASALSRGLRPRLRRRYMQNIENFVGSMDFQVAARNQASSKLTSNAGYYDARRRGGSELDETTLTLADMMRDMSVTLHSAEQDVKSDVLTAESAEASLRANVAEGTNPDLKAGAENASNRATQAEKTIDANLAEPVAEGLDKLKDQADHGNTFSARALLGFSIASVLNPSWAGILRAVTSFRGKGQKKFVKK